MERPWINKSKLTIPAPPGTPLTRSLEQPDRTPVLLLIAGPGYGKTETLRALATADAPAGALTIWYTLDPLDADPATFFHYLVAAVQAHIPDFGTDVLALLGSDRLDPRLLWQRVFAALDAYNLPLVRLILDDTHHLFEPQPDVFAALTAAFEHLPPWLRVWIAARRKPPGPLTRLRTRGIVQVLEEESLRFSPAEAEAYLLAQAGGAEVPPAWIQGAAGVDGWPLGLELVTTQAAGHLAVPGEEALAAYVAEEIVGVQPADRQRFMIAASLLEEVTAEACVEVLDRADAEEVLEALKAERALLAHGPGAFRFPGWLREVLLAEAGRRLGAAGTAEVHRRAAAHHDRRGERERALPHHLAGGDWAAAVQACEASFPTMRFEGRHAPITRWLEAFPPEVRTGEPVLQLWTGHQEARAGRLAEAVEAYERAQSLYEKRGDEAGIFSLMVRRLTLAVRGRDLVRFGKLSLQAQVLVGRGRVEDVADFHLARAQAADHRGDAGLSRECNQAVLDLPALDSVEGSASLAIARINLFTSAFHHGALDEAAQHIDQAVEVAERCGLYAYRHLAVVLKAHLRLTTGDPAGAGTLLRGLPPDGAALMEPHMAAVAHVVEGAHHAARGAEEAAEEAFGRALSTFEAAGYVEARKLPLEHLARLWIQRGQPRRAVELATLEAAAVRTPSDMALDLVRARALDLDGQGTEALAILGPLVTELDEADVGLARTRARLFAAAAAQRLGRAAEARGHLAEANALIEARGYGFLRAQDMQLWQELSPLGEAAPEVIAPAGEPPAAAPPPPARPEPRPAVAEAATERPSPEIPSPEPEPPPPEPDQGMLTLRCLGTFDVRREGVPLDHWPRRKAKLVLAALVLKPTGLKIRELAELVGDGDADSGDAILRVNVPTLRRTLEPNLSKGEASAFVKLEEGRYRLAWERVAALDLHDFEAKIAAGEAARSAGQPGEAVGPFAEALALYRGDLFDDAALADYFELERDRFMRLAVDAALFISDWRREAGDPVGAEAVLRRVSELAPCEEAVYIALMRHHQAVGRPDRARQAYWDCRKALKQHLGVEPSAELEAAAALHAPAGGQNAFRG